MLADAAAGLPGPLHSVISPFCVAGYHSHDSLGGEPLYVVRAGLCSPHAVMTAVTPTQFLAWHVLRHCMGSSLTHPAG